MEGGKGRQFVLVNSEDNCVLKINSLSDEVRQVGVGERDEVRQVGDRKGSYLMSSPTVSSRQTLTLRELWMDGILTVKMIVCILPTDN